MGQFQWTVLGQTGKKYNVGIYHGDKSGHLMIHCNSKVVQVDFYVTESKTYSFFIDDEFFELEVEKKDSKFLYGLKLNTTADTPLNNLRKEQDKRHWAKTVLFTILFLAAAFIVAFGIPKILANKSEGNKALILSEKGVDGIAEIRFDSKNQKFNYFFVEKGKIISKSIDNQLIKPIIPLGDGDKFPIRFAKNFPELHTVHWEKILPQQVEHYKKRTTVVHQHLHPKFSKTKIKCQLDLAYQLDSLKGLAQFFFQNEDSATNSDFNQATYQKYIRDEPFRRLSKEKCWP